MFGFEHCSPYSTITTMNVIYHVLVVNQLHSNHVVLISRDGHEIAVVYFRCGYGPNSYKSDTVGICILGARGFFLLWGDRIEQ